MLRDCQAIRGAADVVDMKYRAQETSKTHCKYVENPLTQNYDVDQNLMREPNFDMLPRPMLLLPIILLLMREHLQIYPMQESLERCR